MIDVKVFHAGYVKKNNCACLFGEETASKEL
jgi:hypothetical protein